MACQKNSAAYHIWHACRRFATPGTYYVISLIEKIIKANLIAAAWSSGSERCFTTTMIARLMVQLSPKPVVASLDKMLHDNYLCSVEFNKQQIEEVRYKNQAENADTRATSKRVWVCSMHSASVASS